MRETQDPGKFPTLRVMLLYLHDLGRENVSRVCLRVERIHSQVLYCVGVCSKMANFDELSHPGSQRMDSTLQHAAGCHVLTQRVIESLALKYPH